jgi:phosphonate transport system ATP-binding protein
LRAGKVAYDGPSSALTPAFLNQLYGAESEELFLPSFDGQGVAAPAAAGPHWSDPPALANGHPSRQFERLSA